MMDNVLNLIELIEEYASLYMTVDEIAILLDLDYEEFRREIRHRQTDRAKAYLRGKLQTELELRRSTKMFAEKGSPQAESQMHEFSIKQRLSE